MNGFLQYTISISLVFEPLLTFPWLLTITQSYLVCLKTRTEICECPMCPCSPPTALLRRRPGMVSVFCPALLPM